MSCMVVSHACKSKAFKICSCNALDIKSTNLATVKVENIKMTGYDVIACKTDIGLIE